MTGEDQLIERLKNPEFYYLIDQLRENIRHVSPPWSKITSDKDLISLIVTYSQIYNRPFEVWYQLDHNSMTWESFVLECKSRVTEK